MEQRVGKSYVAIRAVLRKGTFPVLIVTPYSAVLSWKTALTDFKQSDIQILEGNTEKRVKALLQYHRWFITNYEAYRTIPEELYNVEWSCIILDESDTIKNPKAKVTKYYISLGDAVQHKYILSGTFDILHPTNYFSPLRFLSSEIFGSNYYGFLKRYFYKPAFKWILRKNKKEAFARILSKYTYTLKRADIPGFKKTTYETVIVDKSQIFITLENNLLYKYELIFKEIYKQTIWVTVMMQWYRLLCGGFIFDINIDKLKLNKLKELACKPIVIFACFKIEVRTIAKYLNIPFIDGSVNVKTRRHLVENHRGSIVINPHSFSMGGNLSHYNTVVFYSLPYSLRLFKQAVDRLVMYGKDTHCIYLLRKDTIDEDIYKAHKKNLSESKTMQSLIKKYTLIKEG